MTSGDVMDEARKVYLNDASASLYTNTALIPMLSAAYDELCQELELNGTSHLQEVSTTITVTAGAVTLTLPSDFVKPIRLKERAVGGNADSWEPMTELNWEPTVTQDQKLTYWNYREDTIKLLGATTNREVLLYYYKSLTPITTNAITIPIVNSKRFLALKTAALAAKFIGMNTILGDRLEGEAQSAMNRLIGNNIREQQGRPVRRRPFSHRRRNQYYISES